jgi:hypothetical protein
VRAAGKEYIRRLLRDLTRMGWSEVGWWLRHEVSKWLEYKVSVQSEGGMGRA